MIKPTEQEKINIYNRYNKITHQNAVDDFNKLKKIIEDGNFNNIKPKSRIGNLFSPFPTFSRFSPFLIINPILKFVILILYKLLKLRKMGKIRENQGKLYPFVCYM